VLDGFKKVYNLMPDLWQTWTVGKDS
jgi:hypothetical protein